MNGPEQPQPVVSASMVVDEQCPSRIARSATMGGLRQLAVFLMALVPSSFSWVLWRHALSGATGWTVLVLVVVTFVVTLALVLGIVRLTLRSFTERMYRGFLPVGSTLSVDYYPDRMIATSAGGTRRETPYAGLRRMRVTRHCVVWDSGLGSGALPIEVVPPAAQGLIRSALGGGPSVPTAAT